MRQLAIVVLLMTLSGCGSVDSAEMLLGQYKLESRTATIFLELRADHTYSETVKYAQGGEESSSNRWDWRVTCVTFNAFLLPEIDDVHPQAFFGSETTERLHLRKTARGTYQLDWCLAGEKVLGRTRLVPYPDADVFFYKATR